MNGTAALEAQMASRTDKWMWAVSIGSAFAPGILISLGRSGMIGPYPGTFFGLGLIAGLAIAGGVLAGRNALTISRRQAAPTSSFPSSP
jgi:hypothetical protein